MNSTEFNLFHKELRRLVERRRMDGKEEKEILRELTERLVKIPGREFTAEQISVVLTLVIREPIRRTRETTYWIHWESGRIDCAGRDLDKVKDMAAEQARENGMAYFIT